MAISLNSHLCICASSESSLSISSLIPSPSPLRSAAISEDSAFLLTHSKHLLQIHLPTSSLTLNLPSIKQVSCNSSIAGFVSTSGEVYLIGLDLHKYGILSIKDCYEMHCPTRIMPEIIGSSICISESYAVLLGDDGKMYTWGSDISGKLNAVVNCERQPPCKVQSTRIFLVVQVICKENWICICTAGGFVYIFGELPCCIDADYQDQQPYPVKQLEKMFISKIEACRDFLAVFSDIGEVYFVDECLNVVKLPEKYSQIAGSERGVYAISKGDSTLHEWKSKNKDDCKVRNLKHSVYMIDEIVSNVKIHSGCRLTLSLESRFNLVEKEIFKLLYCKTFVTGNGNAQKNVIYHRIAPIKSRNKAAGVLVDYWKKSINRGIRKFFEKAQFNCKWKRMIIREERKTILQHILSSITLRVVLNRKKCGMKKFMDCYTEANKIKSGMEYCRIRALDIVFRYFTKNVYQNAYGRLMNSRKFNREKLHSIEKLIKFVHSKMSSNFNYSFKKILKVNYYQIGLANGLQVMFNVIDLLCKGHFFRKLKQINLSKIKQYNVINEILSFSGKKHSRLLMLKYYHRWKKDVISYKLTEINKKYSRNIKIKKLVSILSVLIRKPHKIGFSSLKKQPKSNNKKNCIILLNNLLSNSVKKILKSSFKDLESNRRQPKIFFSLVIKILKRHLLESFELFDYYLEKRKIFKLTTILINLESRVAKKNYQKIYQGFGRLKRHPVRCASPGVSILENPLISNIERIKQRKSLSPCTSRPSGYIHKSIPSSGSPPPTITRTDKKSLTQIIVSLNFPTRSNKITRSNTFKNLKVQENQKKNNGRKLIKKKTIKLGLSSLRSGKFIEFSDDSIQNSPRSPANHMSMADEFNKSVADYPRHLPVLIRAIQTINYPVISSAFRNLAISKCNHGDQLTPSTISCNNSSFVISPWELQLFTLGTAIMKNLFIKRERLYFQSIVISS